MIGWFRKWWPWGRESWAIPPHEAMVPDWRVEDEIRQFDLGCEMNALKIQHKRAIKAKKKRSHIEARMKEIRTELLRMEGGK